MTIIKDYLASAQQLAKRASRENAGRVQALLSYAECYADPYSPKILPPTPTAYSLYLPSDWTSLKRVNSLEEATTIVSQLPPLPIWTGVKDEPDQNTALEKVSKQAVTEINHGDIKRYMANLYANACKFPEAIEAAKSIGEFGATGAKIETFCDVATYAADIQIDVAREILVDAMDVIGRGKWIYGDSGNTKVVLYERMAAIQNYLGNGDAARARITDALKVCRHPLFPPRKPF